MTFDQKAQEKLGYYVYGLFDPRAPSAVDGMRAHFNTAGIPSQLEAGIPRTWTDLMPLLWGNAKVWWQITLWWTTSAPRQSPFVTQPGRLCIQGRASSSWRASCSN